MAVDRSTASRVPLNPLNRGNLELAELNVKYVQMMEFLREARRRWLEHRGLTEAPGGPLEEPIRPITDFSYEEVVGLTEVVGWTILRLQRCLTDQAEAAAPGSNLPVAEMAVLVMSDLLGALLEFYGLY